MEQCGHDAALLPELDDHGSAVNLPASEGLKLREEEDFDVVITDPTTREMNGLELCFGMW